MLQEAGFKILREDYGKWDELPIPRRTLHADFTKYTDKSFILQPYFHGFRRDAVTPALSSITVGVTCYNAEHSIQRAIRSALDQLGSISRWWSSMMHQHNSWLLIQATNDDQRVVPRHETNQGLLP